MLQKLKILFLFFLLPTICMLAFTLRSNAQTQTFNITTSPNAFDLTADPGQTLKETIKLRNNSDSTQNLKIEIKKLIPTQNGQITIRDFKKEEDYQHWISLENTEIKANSREWSFITFTINVPKTAAFGYYYALVISPERENQQAQTPQAKLTGEIAIPVLLAVQKDGMKFQGSFDEFKASSNVYEYLPTDFMTTFANTGNVHVKPVGSIFIKDIFGREVAVLPINKEQGSVLPSAKRTFATSWTDSFIYYEKQDDGSPLRSEASKKLKIKFEKILDLRIGKYTANALVVVSAKDRDYSFEKSTTFWVFPWKIILGILIFVLLAGIGFVSTAKSTTRKIKGLFKK